MLFLLRRVIQHLDFSSLIGFKQQINRFLSPFFLIETGKCGGSLILRPQGFVVFARDQVLAGLAHGFGMLQYQHLKHFILPFTIDLYQMQAT